jgi:opacity protein-like surface antigen
MKKLIFCAAALAAMTVAGGASAQSAECARGSHYSDPCGNAGVVIPQPNYSTGEGVYGNHQWGWNTGVMGAGPYSPYYLPGFDDRRDRRARNDRDRDGIRDSRDTDRDGDGVRNNRDRYPDDRRYR